MALPGPFVSSDGRNRAAFCGHGSGCGAARGSAGTGARRRTLVYGLNLRVLMAFAQGQAPVDLIQGLDAGVPDGVVGADGLSAAADTAAGAGHDLDEDIVGLAALYPADKLLGVLQTVGHGHLQGGAVEVNGGLLDGVDVAPYGVKLQPGQGLAGVELVGGAQGGLHNAAGSAEDGAGAGARCPGGSQTHSRAARTGPGPHSG